MKRSEFIEEAYRRADKAGRIDDERVIKFYLDMFLDMGMLPPEQDYQIEEGVELGFTGISRVSELSWEPEEEIEATGAQGAEDADESW